MGRTAVITGGAGGIGAALADRFAGAGMAVVVSDLAEDRVDATVARLTDQGARAIGVVTDVGELSSVEALRDRAYAEFGGVHVLCNNAGVGAGAEGNMWEHTINDWGWGLNVNLWGMIHGVKAFVPAMLEAGEPGHVVNTSSGNGGIAPLPTTAVYATSKAAVTAFTEVLYGQLHAVNADIGVSVLFPGPNVLKTGLLESSKNRPEAWANDTPRKTPYTTIESFEARMRAAGIDLNYTPVEFVAEATLDAILENRFWILPESDRTDQRIRARADSMLHRSQPTYMEA
ncbi:MAG: SDR family NAD(P)-dependent oxidoreductase [Microthrixaceae bacterium]|nr:SDR family NAD(P)-dependent oxidoreductase [Microthrixaceae bacterium]